MQGSHPYDYLEVLWLRRGRGGDVRNESLLVEIGVSNEGFRQVLAAGVTLYAVMWGRAVEWLAAWDEVRSDRMDGGSS
jgi:transposase-like protein